MLGAVATGSSMVLQSGTDKEKLFSLLPCILAECLISFNADVDCQRIRVGIGRGDDVLIAAGDGYSYHDFAVITERFDHSGAPILHSCRFRVLLDVWFRCGGQFFSGAAKHFSDSKKVKRVGT